MAGNSNSRSSTRGHEPNPILFALELDVRMASTGVAKRVVRREGWICLGNAQVVVSLGREFLLDLGDNPFWNAERYLDFYHLFLLLVLRAINRLMIYDVRWNLISWLHDGDDRILLVQHSWRTYNTARGQATDSAHH